MFSAPRQPNGLRIGDGVGSDRLQRSVDVGPAVGKEFDESRGLDQDSVLTGRDRSSGNVSDGSLEVGLRDTADHDLN